MATTGFTMDTAQAVSLDSLEVDALRRIARESSVWLIAGVALRDDHEPTHAVNGALAIDPQGEIVAIHRKQRLFAYGEEDQYYQPGTEGTTVDIGGGGVGRFVRCQLGLARGVSRV